MWDDKWEQNPNAQRGQQGNGAQNIPHGLVTSVRWKIPGARGTVISVSESLVSLSKPTSTASVNSREQGEHKSTRNVAGELNAKLTVLTLSWERSDNYKVIIRVKVFQSLGCCYLVMCSFSWCGYQAAGNAQRCKDTKVKVFSQLTHTHTHTLSCCYPFHHCITSASSPSISNSFFPPLRHCQRWLYPHECKDIAWL